jgi:hypothetical protein
MKLLGGGNGFGGEQVEGAAVRCWSHRAAQGRKPVAELSVARTDVKALATIKVRAVVREMQHHDLERPSIQPMKGNWRRAPWPAVAGDDRLLIPYIRTKGRKQETTTDVKPAES